MGQIGLEYILNAFEMKNVELAEKLGVSRKLITEWIKGRKSIPTKRLDQLEDIFPTIDVDLFEKELTQSDIDRIDVGVMKFKNNQIIEIIEEIIMHPEKKIEVEDVHNLILSLYKKMILDEDSRQLLTKKMNLTKSFFKVMIDEDTTSSDIRILWDIFDLMHYEEGFMEDIAGVIYDYVRDDRFKDEKDFEEDDEDE